MDDFEDISSLPDDVQAEIIAEANLRLEAQLTVAIAADQRALTFGGFLIATATAAIGGGVALITKDQPDYLLAAVAITYSFAVLYASWEALRTVMPDLFCLPGNRPGNWLPDQWEGHGTHKPSMVRARVEQSKHMNNAIIENSRSAEAAARAMHRSFKTVMAATLAAALIMCSIIIFRFGITTGRAEAVQAGPIATKRLVERGGHRRTAPIKSLLHPTTPNVEHR